jgi:hypothetical protein
MAAAWGIQVQESTDPCRIAGLADEPAICAVNGPAKSTGATTTKAGTSRDFSTLS